MGSDIVIEIEGITKAFRQRRRASGYTTLKSALINTLRGKRIPVPTVEVISDVSLCVSRGCTMGVIGRNGSGKTTLLKLLAGIYRPTRGRIMVRGRVSALIELGAGFHPEFSGRENVMLNGMILGLSRRQVRERFDSIVDFAELRDVIDNPVRTYSSGMYMRLGFSVAVHVNPDVLLIDEVLAVGDAPFVKKCEGRLGELKQRGTTLILVTHDLEAVSRWCDQTVWLESGRVAAVGATDDVTLRYREAMARAPELGS